jgi:hypothetical protein
MIEGKLNTFKLLRIHCSSGIIRSLEWIFNLDNDSEKVVLKCVISNKIDHNRHRTMKKILTNKLYDLDIQLGLSWIRAIRPVYVDITLLEKRRMPKNCK